MKRLLLLIFVLSALSFAVNLQASPPTHEGRILFISDRVALFSYDIYSMNPDGSDQVNLTEIGGSISDAAWSPDGASIAFAYLRRDFDTDIWIMDADGSNPRALTQYGGDERQPAWSPDGTQIAFHGQRDGNIEIYTVTVADGTITRLTNSPGNDIRPVWSPDGAYIAFETFRDGNKEVYVMDANGRNPRNASNLPLQDDDPAWSPDSATLAFTSEGENHDSDIFLLTLSTGELQNLTHDFGTREIHPTWSPDGTRITYESRTSSGENRELYVMNAEGSNPVNLSQNSGEDISASWSPDGSRIAFLSYREDEGLSSLYLINADGSGLRRLTYHDGDGAPLWSPGTIGELIPQATACPSDYAGFLTPRLQVGGEGRVMADQAANRVRLYPGLNAELLSTIPGGGMFTVIGGPSCDSTDGIIWWQVRTDAGLIGWTAEGVLPDEYFLEPM